MPHVPSEPINNSSGREGAALEAEATPVSQSLAVAQIAGNLPVPENYFRVFAKQRRHTASASRLALAAVGVAAAFLFLPGGIHRSANHTPSQIMRTSAEGDGLAVGTGGETSLTYDQRKDALQLVYEMRAAESDCRRAQDSVMKFLGEHSLRESAARAEFQKLTEDGAATCGDASVLIARAVTKLDTNWPTGLGHLNETAHQLRESTGNLSESLQMLSFALTEGGQIDRDIANASIASAFRKQHEASSRLFDIEHRLKIVN